MGLFDFLFGRGKSGRDGSSAEKAIVVGSVAEEYQWLQQNCPGWTLQQQSLRDIEGKPYGVMTLQSNNGDERDVYFDIGRFFGK